MRKIAITLLALAAPLAVSASAQVDECIFSSIATEDVGTGVGSCHDNHLAASLATAKCQLQFELENGPFICGNNFLTQHWLLFGPESPFPLPLADPFIAGSTLLVLPSNVVGPNPGDTSNVGIPQDPGLIGATVNVQSVTQFLFTLAPPGQNISYGLSQELRITFH